jgi:8-oxo-dGTP diphosphatase
MPYTYEFPHPAVTVDIVLLRRGAPGVEVLLIQRAHPPFAEHWALPGGFVDQGETLAQAAHRELEEETGLRETQLQQLAAFGAPGRDPRGWVISIAFWGWVKDNLPGLRAGDDASNAAWWPLTQLPALAFDHAHILATAQEAANLV